jgi:hypothetical protein
MHLFATNFSKISCDNFFNVIRTEAKKPGITTIFISKADIEKTDNSNQVTQIREIYNNYKCHYNHEAIQHLQKC